MLNNFVRKNYDIIAENYLSKRNQFENKKYLERLQKLLKTHSTVLDIGCGAGIPIDSFLIEHGHHVTGIDISEKQIELAKKHVPKGKFSVQDMSTLKEKQFAIDAVVSFYAIFHTSREFHEPLFKTISSFLPKDGLLLVTMGASNYEGTEENFFGAPMFWSHYAPETNRKLIKNAGFKVIFDEIDIHPNERHQVIIAKKV